jgi:hypothetical protein
MGSENPQGCEQNAENVFGLDFFRGRPQRWRLIFQSIMRVTGDETWASFVNIETEEQSGSMHTHSLN